jgi:hypothetical protein
LSAIRFEASSESPKRMILIVLIGKDSFGRGVLFHLEPWRFEILNYSAETCAPFCGTERFIMKTSATNGTESKAKTRKISK